MPEHTHSSGGIQRGPRRADNFTILSNAVLNDARLSFRARGVLMWLLSKPADWRTRSESIAAQSPKEGREAIRTAMRELEEYGYLVREKVRDASTGQISTIQTVFEEPTGTEPQVMPEPRKPASRRASAGKSGLFTKDRSPRTETNNNQAGRGPRQCETNPKALLSEKVQEINTADAAKVAELEQATLAAGLPASYARIKATQRTEILALIDQHGVQALAAAAQRAHRGDNPTLHVNGWLRLWTAMPAPRTTPTPPTPAELKNTCGDCVGGWIEDADHNPLRRCTCQAVAR